MVLAVVCALDALDRRAPSPGHVHGDDPAPIVYYALYLPLRGIQPSAAGNLPDRAHLWHSTCLPHSRPHKTENCRKDLLCMTDEVVKQRKLEHVTIALEQDVSAPQRAGWGDIRFVHQALPEVNLDEIDTAVTFLGHRLRYPIFVSSLTGGHAELTSINRNLARAAEEYGLALGVGSQRSAIVNPDVAPSYAVTRQFAPNAFLIANIGAPQLIAQSRHPAFRVEQAQQAIDMIEANALAVHMNSLQEAAQPEGDRRSIGE